MLLLFRALDPLLALDTRLDQYVDCEHPSYVLDAHATDALEALHLEVLRLHLQWRYIRSSFGPPQDSCTQAREGRQYSPLQFFTLASRFHA